MPLGECFEGPGVSLEEPGVSIREVRILRVEGFLQDIFRWSADPLTEKYTTWFTPKISWPVAGKKNGVCLCFSKVYHVRLGITMNQPIVTDIWTVELWSGHGSQRYEWDWARNPLRMKVVKVDIIKILHRSSSNNFEQLIDDPLQKLLFEALCICVYIYIYIFFSFLNTYTSCFKGISPTQVVSLSFFLQLLDVSRCFKLFPLPAKVLPEHTLAFG